MLADDSYNIMILLKIIKFLNSKGANIYKKDNRGNNAIQIVRNWFFRDNLKIFYLINRFKNKVLYMYIYI